MTITRAQQMGFSMVAAVSDSPVLDTERLLLHVLHLSESNFLITHGNQTLSSSEEKHFLQLLEERMSGKPLAYILETWEFYGREFLITPGVLVPRPATESLVEQALIVISNMATSKKRNIVVADIGTGSGCVAITLALESPFIEKIIATDISATALEVAKKNAVQYKVTDTIDFVHGDMLKPLTDKAIDLIVSNPPYVPTTELRSPSTKTTAGLHFEPKIALDGGPDGLRFVRSIQASNIPAIIETVGGTIIKSAL